MVFLKKPLGKILIGTAAGSAAVGAGIYALGISDPETGRVLSTLSFVYGGVPSLVATLTGIQGIIENKKEEKHWNSDYILDWDRL